MRNPHILHSWTSEILITVMAFVSLLSGAASGQSYVFNEAVSTAGHNPQAVATADFNADGRPDFVVANYNDSTVSVFLGNAQGTYPTPTTYATGPNPIALLVADFNKDGKLDLAAINNNCPTTPCPSAGSVSILLGNGDGTFSTTPINTTVGNGPFGFATADYNKDGKPDLAVSNRADNTVSVLIGNGDGTFSTAELLTVGNSPAGVLAIDVNQDGSPDVVVANSGDSDVSLFVGHGNGKFGAQNTYPTGAGPVGLAMGDFNSDSIPDLVTANSGATTVSVLVSKGGSGNGFNPHMDFTVVGPVTGVFIDDVNSDNNQDIIAVSPNSNAFSVLLGGGSVQFQNHMDFATGNGPAGIVATDFTGDNFQDIAVVNATDNTLALYPGWNTGAFQLRKDTATGNQPGTIATGDFNGDGIQDMAIVNRSDGTVETYLGNGDGTFTPVPSPPLTGSNPSWVAAADFNGDTHLDLVVTNAVSNTISVFLGKGDGTFFPGTTTNVGKNPVAVASADFNGDGIPDLAVVNQNDPSVDVFQGNGSGGFTLLKSYTTGKGSTPGEVALVDLVGNGIIDMVVAGGASNAVAVYFGFGNGTFTSPVTYAVGTNPTGVAATDLNGDGIQDIVTANNGSNNVSVLLGSGKGKFGLPALNYPTAASPYLVVTQDFNGDGHMDVAVSSSSTSNRVSVLLGNGDGTLQLNVNHQTKFMSKGLGEGLATADFNGDGAFDLAASDQFSSNASVFLSIPVPAFSPGGALNFNGVNIDTQSNPIAELLTNSGNAPLNALSITANPPFAETTTCGSTLAIAANCTTSAMFTPTNYGASSGSLAFADDAPTSPQILPMSGFGNGPQVTLSVNNLVFGVTLVGQTSPLQKVTLTNTGNQTLTITSIVASANFKATSTCGATVLAGANCVITVGFHPTSSGVKNGTVTISDNASDTPQIITLMGTATAVKLTPTSLSFGTQKVGTTSLPQTVTVMNTGTTPINFTAAPMITGANPSDFMVQAAGTTCSTSTPLGGGASCTIAVVFAPTMTGSRTATLSIADTGGASPQTVALTGTGN